MQAIEELAISTVTCSAEWASRLSGIRVAIQNGHLLHRTNMHYMMYF